MFVVGFWVMLKFIITILRVNKLKSNHVNSRQIEVISVTTMSLRPFCKLFKPFKKNEKQDAESVSISYEGLDLSIKSLLAYVGKQDTDIKIWNLQDEESGKGQNFVQGEDKAKTDNKCGLHGTAILRCLGKCHGLSGADPFEDLEIDQIVEVFNEFRMVLLSIDNNEKRDEKSAAIAKDGQTEALAYLMKFDAVVAANRGHLALNKLTWADFLVVGIWDRVKSTLGAEVVTKFPNIKGMVENILTKTTTKHA